VIDDLWKMGKPIGTGGPWKDSEVSKGAYSDPYLIGFYDKKKLTLTHNSDESVTFSVEINPIGHGPWMEYLSLKVEPGESLEHIFPGAFQARWIRFKLDKGCRATAWLVYE
jgi:hypothetical protein